MKNGTFIGIVAPGKLKHKKMITRSGLVYSSVKYKADIKQEEYFDGSANKNCDDRCNSVVFINDDDRHSVDARIWGQWGRSNGSFPG